MRKNDVGRRLQVRISAICSNALVFAAAAGLGWPEQIPAIASDIQKYGNLSVGLETWFAVKVDAMLQHVLVEFVKVVDPQEESNAPSVLIANHLRLSLTISKRDKQASASRRRAYNDPTFRAPVIGERWFVFDQCEPQTVDEEVNCGIVVIDNKRDQIEVHGETARDWLKVGVARRTWEGDYVADVAHPRHELHRAL